MTLAPVAIVASTAGRTGCVLAVGLARAGLDVALVGRDEQAWKLMMDQVAALDRRSVALAAEVTDTTSVRDALAHVCTVLGEPTVLVNSVDATSRGPLPESGPDDWDATVIRPLRAAFVLTRAVIDPMVKNGGGRIITVADVAGPPGGNCRENLTVRAGLEGFTRTMALELEPLGVTVNLVAALRRPPGVTPRPDRTVSPAYSARAARTVSLLVSPEAKFISGQAIYAWPGSEEPHATA